jgi:hypothetical protein
LDLENGVFAAGSLVLRQYLRDIGHIGQTLGVADDLRLDADGRNGTDAVFVDGAILVDVAGLVDGIDAHARIGHIGIETPILEELGEYVHGLLDRLLGIGNYVYIGIESAS